MSEELTCENVGRQNTWQYLAQNIKYLFARRDWPKIFKVMKSKDPQTRLLYPAKPSFRLERHIKNFPDKEKLKEFITTEPVLRKML